MSKTVQAQILSVLHTLVGIPALGVQGFEHGEGSSWGRRSMTEIPEWCVLASAQLGVRLWEENPPRKSIRV